MVLPISIDQLSGLSDPHWSDFPNWDISIYSISNGLLGCMALLVLELLAPHLSCPSDSCTLPGLPKHTVTKGMSLISADRYLTTV